MERQIIAFSMFAAALGAATGLATAVAETARRPNVIVIYSDDHGWADMGCQGVRKDVKTPNLDALAARGVRMTAGYATAPQCVPSRAGLLTGRYQQRFGVDANGKGPLPLSERTLADRLQSVGHHTGMVGKWHLQPNSTDVEWIRRNVGGGEPLPPSSLRRVPAGMTAPFQPGRRGFIDFFHGEMNVVHANYDLSGKPLAPDGERIETGLYRVDAQTEAAVQFIRRKHGNPFFLYVGYYAPHVPTAAPQSYLDRFPNAAPAKRRYGLAMIAAIDDGVGRIVAELNAFGLVENTLIVFAGDNGAPIDLTATDVPISNMVWDGSRNDPWVGEKGMLTEGGVRVPFVMSWPGRLPTGVVYDEPVSTLDVSATALAAAGVLTDATLDGVDLAPYLNGEKAGAPHEALYWRFWSQSAVRVGRWKYLRLGDRAEYLFDLESSEHESRNLVKDRPEVATELKAKLQAWAQELNTPGLVERPTNAQEVRWYAHYLGLNP